MRVHRGNNANLEKMYLNVWYDGNRDGDWEDTDICDFTGGQQARSYEWIVQDFAVDMTQINQGDYVDIPVTTLLVHSAEPRKGHWMRFTLSERQAPRNPQTNLADGRGPSPNGQPADFQFGETEDFLQRPDPEGQVQQDDLILQKRVISTTTPVEYADTVTYQIRLKNNGDAAVQAEIRDEIPYPQHLLPRASGAGVVYVDVTEISPGVSPLQRRVGI